MHLATPEGYSSGFALSHMAKVASGKKILVAEDDPDTLRLLTKVLSREGFKVIAAQDGREALKKATRERPAAILLDIIMPKLDGIEVCAKLKARKSTAHIPVGFLTARTDPEACQQALQQGGMFCLTKPFQYEKLVNLVCLLLASRSTARRSTR